MATLVTREWWSMFVMMLCKQKSLLRYNLRRTILWFIKNKNCVLKLLLCCVSYAIFPCTFCFIQPYSISLCLSPKLISGQRPFSTVHGSELPQNIGNISFWQVSTSDHCMAAWYQCVRVKHITEDSRISTSLICNLVPVNHSLNLFPACKDEIAWCPFWNWPLFNKYIHGVLLVVLLSQLYTCSACPRSFLQAFFEGKLKITGNIMLAQKLQELFNQQSKLWTGDGRRLCTLAS